MLRALLQLAPPVRRWFAEFDDLRARNNRLQEELRTSNRELQLAQEQYQHASEELERMKRANPRGIVPALWTPPGHFYSPIPDLRDLKANEDEIFDIPPSIRGVPLHDHEQISLLESFATFYPEQPFTSEKTPERRYFFENPNYSYSDGIILYCMIRHLRPGRIVEVGSGYSSCAMLDVNELFFDNSIACTFIDPYPQLLRQSLGESDVSRGRIIGQKVQDVDVSIFEELEASDILFIDSSHVAKTGSDVNYVFFKILPLLAKGVYIHFHDILYPFEYPREWAFEGRAWNEAYLLRAFLEYNHVFTIRFFTDYMMRKYGSVFASKLPLCLNNAAGGIWLEKIEHDPELNRVHDAHTRRTTLAPRKIEPWTEYRWLLGKGWQAGEGNH